MNHTKISTVTHIHLFFPQESELFKQKTQAESSDPIGDVLDMIKAREDAVGYSSDEDESEEEEEWDD